MTRADEFFARRLPPSLSAGSTSLFSELHQFWDFIREQLKPFPGRAHAMVRLVTSALITLLISETLRIPEPAFSAYLVFFIANEDGIASVKMGLLAMVGLTITLVASIGVTICFMDAPWFRLPVTFLLIAGAVWLSRTLVLAVMGRLMAVILALYLSLADTVFDAEALTEATLWLWSIVGVAVGVTAVVSVALEPRPDLLLRAQIVASLGEVEKLLQACAGGRGDRQSLARSLRRQLYGAPQRMRLLLARWRQRAWPVLPHDTDWELAIMVTERLLSVTAALATSDLLLDHEETRRALTQLSGTVGRLWQAVESRDRETIRSLEVPAMEGLPDSADKAGLVELATALSESRSVLTPVAAVGDPPGVEKATPQKPGLLVPDALTNSEYAHFAIKTTLAVLACEIFMNAVDWPGIRTAMITCVITALATEGAQRQKQLLRLTGACVGGVMGLVAIIYIVPKLDTIVGLLLLVGTGTACCAWVAAGSARSSYAGFQMALAFFIMLLPSFETSIDLTTIRDRFVGVLVGITAMWIFFDHLWYTSSRRMLVDKLIELLQLMAKAPGTISSAMSPVAARGKVTSFRRELYGGLSAGRLLLDETKMETALSLDPRTVRGTQLEEMGSEISFAAFLLLALNEKKLRLLATGALEPIQSVVQPMDEELARSLTLLAQDIHRFQETVLQKGNEKIAEPVSRPTLEWTRDPSVVGPDLQPVYDILRDCIGKIWHLERLVRALPERRGA
jgi:multidrug resistance protein MdtO